MCFSRVGARDHGTLVSHIQRSIQGLSLLPTLLRSTRVKSYSSNSPCGFFTHWHLNIGMRGDNP
jgi:hypothetical protein